MTRDLRPALFGCAVHPRASILNNPNKDTYASSHTTGCLMEVVGVPSYSTHWMGRATPPRLVTAEV